MHGRMDAAGGGSFQREGGRLLGTDNHPGPMALVAASQAAFC